MPRPYIYGRISFAPTNHTIKNTPLGAGGLKKKNPDKQKLIEVHKNGGYLLSRAQDGLPSAMLGLTSLFGMGRGGTPAP